MQRAQEITSHHANHDPAHALAYLVKPAHVRPIHEEKRAVAVQKDAGRPPAEEGPPPPPMILGCQLEVGQRNGDKRGHHDQDHKHDEKDGKGGVVELVTPGGYEDIVQLHVNGTERKKPCSDMVACARMLRVPV